MTLQGRPGILLKNNAFVIIHIWHHKLPNILGFDLPFTDLNLIIKCLFKLRLNMSDRVLHSLYISLCWSLENILKWLTSPRSSFDCLLVGSGNFLFCCSQACLVSVLVKQRSAEELLNLAGPIRKKNNVILLNVLFWHEKKKKFLRKNISCWKETLSHSLKAKMNVIQF